MKKERACAVGAHERIVQIMAYIHGGVSVIKKIFALHLAFEKDIKAEEYGRLG